MSRWKPFDRTTIVEKLEKALLGIVAALCLALFIGFVRLAISGYLADSEIWSITLAKNIKEELFSPWVYTRPIFYGSLAFATFWFNKAVLIFQSAKVVTLINAALIFFFTARLTKTVQGPSNTNKLAPCFALFFLLANTMFMNQGYRVRSDLLGCTLVLFALERTLRTPQMSNWLKAALWAFPLLTTPKALLQILPAITFLKSKRARSNAAQALVALFLLLVIIYPESIQYFFSTVVSDNTQTPRFLERFVYLRQLIEKNYVWLGLLVMRFVTYSSRVFLNAFFDESERERQRAFFIFFCASMATMLATPEKVPFFLASYIPMAAAFSALLVDDFRALLNRAVEPTRRQAFYCAGLITILFPVFTISLHAYSQWSQYWEDNRSDTQFSAIESLENLLNDYPKATYFDVVGLVPQRATLRYFAGPNDEKTNRNTIALVKAKRPHLIFFVRKMFYLEPEITPFLQEEYFEIAPMVMARWDRPAKPIPISPKNQDQIALLLGASKAAAGKEKVEKISVLFKSGKSKPSQIEVDPAKLLATGTFPRGSTLLALSPFTKIPAPPGFLPSLIRFDIEP